MLGRVGCLHYYGFGCLLWQWIWCKVGLHGHCRGLVTRHNVELLGLVVGHRLGLELACRALLGLHLRQSVLKLVAGLSVPLERLQFELLWHSQLSRVLDGLELLLWKVWHVSCFDYSREVRLLKRWSWLALSIICMQCELYNIYKCILEQNITETYL